MSRHRDRKRRVIVVTVVLAALLLLLVVRHTWLTDRSEPVAVEEALDRFRTETTDATTSEDTAGAPGVAGGDEPTSTPATLPEPGVYRYDTTGGESIDAMGGVARGYPVETTITVTTRGCGVRLRWSPLEQRRDEWELCASGPAVELQPGGLQFHEFFGRSQADEIRCDGAIVLTTTAGVPPTEVERACTLADDPWRQRWEVIGAGALEVDGRDVPVTHLRMTVDDDDEYWEHTTTDWYVADSGLPVRIVVETTSRSPSMVGPVVYEETYELQLESMSPLT